MTITSLRKRFACMLCLVLIVAMALVITGCGNGQGAEAEQAQSAEIDQGLTEAEPVGEGSTQFFFIVVDQDGKETAFVVNTDRETVGEALLDNGLIDGEDGEFGLYVKTVNGIAADYDTDGAYWAFYEGDAYAQKGVDTTSVEEGVTYTFKYEKQ